MNNTDAVISTKFMKLMEFGEKWNLTLAITVIVDRI